MVLVRGEAGRMGTKLITALLLLTLLSGCAPTSDYTPYYLTTGGVKVYAEQEPPVGDAQVLEFCTGEREPLYHTTLNFYSGSLYALSNYRQALLNNGFVTESLTQTGDLLDTVLSDSTERVRLIYQATGTIRIVFENQAGVAHILLEEV